MSVLSLSIARQSIFFVAILSIFSIPWLTDAQAQDSPEAATALGVTLVADESSVTFPSASSPEFDAALAKKLQELSDANSAAALAGNNAWMMTSCALVLFMTIPGLAMFYGGLVRKKNILSILMQCIFLMGMMTILWGLVGYSLAFGEGNPYIGNLNHLFFSGVSMSNAEAPMSGSIPTLTFAAFQCMFFIITPALICGAFAERMKFSAMVLFSAIWGLVIYCPLCHWVWGQGILAFGKDHSILGGAIDFAGGTVVHMSSGISALICAILLKPRVGLGIEDTRPHNLTFTVLGAGMLWVGWFGFNAGSQLASDGLASSAFVATHFSAAAGAVGWAGYEWLTRGKASVLGAASGAVAGLVCITPAAGFVQPMPALVMGALAGIVCYIACVKVKIALKYDDSLDAFGVHGVGGALGAVLTGIFATTQVNTTVDGLWYDFGSGIKLVIGQIAAVVVTLIFCSIGTFIILKIVDMLVGLRVNHEDEIRGLDISQHGEEGYIF